MKIIEFISIERFNTYRKYNNNEEIALNLYDWNIKLSEAFYTPLNYFEIVLRNACNFSISKEKGEYWYLDEKLMSGANPRKGEYSKARIQKTYQKLVGYGKKYPYGTQIEEIKSADIISNLELGFWINLFVQNYFNSFWDPCLKYLFNNIQRKELHNKFDTIRELRNRIFHHENILKFNLYERYKTILEIIEIVSVELSKKLQSVNNFEAVYKRYINYITKNPSAPLNQS